VSEQNANKILNRVEENRRGFLKRVLGTSFAVPLIASFSVGALIASTAEAQALSNTTQTCFGNQIGCSNQFDNQLFLELMWRGSE
jgi:hypothetical protein